MIRHNFLARSVVAGNAARDRLVCGVSTGCGSGEKPLNFHAFLILAVFKLNLCWAYRIHFANDRRKIASCITARPPQKDVG